MDKYSQAYESKFKEMEKKLNNTSISEQLCMKNITDTKLDEICARISQVLNKDVWKDYYFRTGKIFGILRSIVNNPKYRTKLFEITNLNDSIINIYMDVTGNLPYFNGKEIVSLNKPMKCQETKDLIMMVAYKMGVYIDDSDVLDITDDYWKKLYAKKLESAEEDMRFNNKIDATVEYDE